MNNLRVGIIGVGNMGTAHASCIFSGKVNGMVLTALCDNDPAHLKEAENRFNGIAYYSDYKELIMSGTVDAVVVSVPHRLHAAIAEFALNNGINVVVEKPEDVSVSNALRLNAAAKSSGKVFAIMFNQRTNQLFRKAHEIVASGELGELKRSVWIITNWYRTQSYYDSGDWRATWAGEGGGVLLNQAPHNLDLWQWICGMPSSVTAFCSTGKYHNIEVEDDATIYAKYPNGATGVFITTTGECPGTNRLEISGTLGKMVLENGTLKLWKLPVSERDICSNSKESFPNVDTEYTEIRQTEEESAHLGILQNFANAVLFGEPLIASGYEGINELSISNAAYLSEWTGNSEIKLPIDCVRFDELLSKKAVASSYKDAYDSAHETDYSLRWKVNW